MNIPAPGSPEAEKMGCLCPVIDNCHGRGAYLNSKGEPVFWYNSDCPIHAKDEKEKINDK